MRCTGATLRGACWKLALILWLSALTGCSRVRDVSPGSRSASSAGSVAANADIDVGKKIALETDSLKSFHRVYKEAGWEVKGITGATEKKVQTYLSETVSPKIHLVELTPQGGGETQIDTYFYQDAKGLIVLPNLYRVDKIFRFSVGDRPFCYEVRAEIIHLDETNNARTFTGKHSVFHYYDEDNDGRFETFEWGNSDPEPKIPKWVLKK